MNCILYIYIYELYYYMNYIYNGKREERWEGEGLATLTS